MKTVVGIDLGTQSLKVVFYDYSAHEIVASESAALDLYQNDSGSAEQQAHWWITALTEVMGKIDADIRQSAVAVGVSGQQHGFVALGKTGEVLAPVKLWCDTSTVAECDEVMQAYGGAQKCLDEVGNLIMPGYTASKIRWFAKNGGALYDQLDCIMLPHDYLNYYLTGERCMEAGDASGTGLLNITERSWSAEMLKAVDPDRDLSAFLPPLRTEPGIIGHIHTEAAMKTGLPAGIPVSTGGGDNMMGAIGTGNVSPGKVTMSLGTSGTVYAYSDQPIIDPRGEIAAFCSSNGGWLPLLCTMNCTVTTELMRAVMGVDIEEFDISTRDLFPGEKIKIRWRSSGAILFDAIVYLSADQAPSSDDFVVLAEDCSTSPSDHCKSNEDIVFDCLYKSDNSFDCEESDDVISENDLTAWLDTLPKTTNLILELCNDDDCEWESKEMTFH